MVGVPRTAGTLAPPFVVSDIVAGGLRRPPLQGLVEGGFNQMKGGDHLLCPVQVAPVTRPLAYGARGRWIRCLRLTKVRRGGAPLRHWLAGASRSRLPASSDEITGVGPGDGRIRREIGTLKLLKHPNVVRLHEVSASKTKIYLVLEYVTGGELFDKIASRGRLPEHEGRKLFQQLIDAVSYCHGKGVYHRDLKPENVLVDAKRNIKVSNFGLSALPQHLGSDGLLHTTCGSPNYVAPEVLANRGYDGSTSDIWSCGVILYVILTGSLPFDDRNLAVLYQKIFKGETHIPKWLTPGPQRIIRRILDPNPKSRITIDQIKSDDWFKEGYTPAIPDDEDDDVKIDHEAFSIKEAAEIGDHEHVPMLNNAFQLIGMSSCLDLSGFFEKEDASERKIRFTSNYSPRDLFEKIEKIVTEMGFEV